MVEEQRGDLMISVFISITVIIIIMVLMIVSCYLYEDGSSIDAPNQCDTLFFNRLHHVELTHVGWKMLTKLDF